ncbi:MAG: hypothetical protein PVI43_01035 [Candidatus Bathyarchaeota archaeon]|jgi:hypothetical protein
MIWQITKNHYNAALEHIEKNDINHTPTMFQALKVTIYDLIFNHTIYIPEYKSHLVYEVVKMPTLGLRSANVIRIYVPKPHRGKGITSKMLDRVAEKEKIVISGEGKYGEVGRLYLSRKSI